MESNCHRRKHRSCGPSPRSRFHLFRFVVSGLLHEWRAIVTEENIDRAALLQDPGVPMVEYLDVDCLLFDDDCLLGCPPHLKELVHEDVLLHRPETRVHTTGEDLDSMLEI